MTAPQTGMYPAQAVITEGDGTCPNCGVVTPKRGWWCMACLHEKCVRARQEAMGR